ncbi:MAG: fused DSP-PTPase phosphatase/NAD kinase-like protein [Blastocatellia bacterium]
MHHKKILLIAIIIIATLAVAISSIVIGNSVSRKTAVAPAAAGEAAVPPPGDKTAEVTASLPMFRRLNEGYMRGSQPEHGGIDTLRRLGVKTIIDLRSTYDHTDEIGVAAERVGLRYYWLPLSVWNPPADNEAKDIISIVTDESKGPFYVFCSDGIHRTGEVSAIYRVMHDKWSVEQALKEMDELGFNPYYWSLRSYVWAYARKFRPSAVPRAGRGLGPAGP